MAEKKIDKKDEKKIIHLFYIFVLYIPENYFPGIDCLQYLEVRPSKWKGQLHWMDDEMEGCISKITLKIESI